MVSIGLLATFYLSIISSTIYGYVFPCLDECQCDTDDEAIYCHNGRRTTLELPIVRLRGFVVIGLANNAIKKLPDEKTMVEKFPDLLAIDVEGNAQFDCESLKEYQKIKIYSNCNGTEQMIRTEHKLPDIEKPTEMLKKKYDEVDKEKVLKDVKDFFINIAKKIDDLRTN